DWPEGRAYGQEQSGVIARRPCLADIAAERVFDTGFERQDVSLPAFGTEDLDAVRGPINLVHVQPPHLARPQAIDYEQSQMRPVSLLQRRIAIGFGDQVGHGVPRRAERQTFSPINAGRKNRSRQPGPNPAFGFTMAKPDPQGQSGRSDRDAAPV